MSKYINGLSSLELTRNRMYIVSSITGEIVAERVPLGKRKYRVVFDDCALACYGEKLLTAALRKGGLLA